MSRTIVIATVATVVHRMARWKFPADRVRLRSRDANAGHSANA
jgi:hypothetical protein